MPNRPWGVDLSAIQSEARLRVVVCAVGVNPLARGSDARLRGLV